MESFASGEYLLKIVENVYYRAIIELQTEYTTPEEEFIIKINIMTARD